VLKTKNMSHDLGGQSVEDVGEHNLIPSEPCRIVGIGNDGGFLVFLGSSLGQRLHGFCIGSIQEPNKLCATDGRQDPCPPNRDHVSFSEGGAPSLTGLPLLDEVMVTMIRRWARAAEEVRLSSNNDDRDSIR
jgi:hypothetical protein